MCAHTHKCTPVIEIGSVDCALLLADRLSATFFQHLLLDSPDSGEGLEKIWRRSGELLSTRTAVLEWIECSRA